MKNPLELEIEMTDQNRNEPRINITMEENKQQCHSCGARNYRAYTLPVDVDELFAVNIGNSVIVLCRPCVDILRRASHEAIR